MINKINFNIIDKLFLILVISLMFENIPRILKLSFFGSVGGKLAIYPMIMGFIYTSWIYWKQKMFPPYWNTVMKFIVVYIIALLGSFFWGLYNYHYYDILLSYSIDQESKIYIINDFLLKHGVVNDYRVSFILLYILRVVKSVFCDTLCYFGGSYLIFLWYKNRTNKAIDILVQGGIFSGVVLCIYSLFEVAHLSGSLFAKNIIASYFSPVLHELSITTWGWPPAIWDSGVRFVNLHLLVII